ncbi:DUF819 domain-containing protein [Pseudoteredinibacter isoporae]|uniref:DUF819 family protein n=1 Tax=Pseudoteredinibacter isoporae TaxID=570281 RepID=UPI0031090EC9
MSLIPADNVMALYAVLLGLACLGFWIDTLEIGRKISGVVWVLLAAMLLSNFHIIPFQSSSYDFVGSSLVPLAIPLLLFKSNLRRIFKDSGRVMLAFFVAACATTVAAIVGFMFFNLGDIGAKVAGVYSGGFIGGAVNFLAVSKVVGMSESEFSTAISASSIVSMLALMLLLAIPSVKWVLRFFKDTADVSHTEDSEFSSEGNVAALKLSHISGALALSFGICALSNFLAQWFSAEQYSFLIITIFSLAIANIFPKTMAELEGEFEAGLLLMYLFFAVAGAGTDMSSFLGVAITLFFYGMFIIFGHLLITLIVCRVLGFNLQETLVASAAALVGPAVTAAIAISKGWRDLVTPGIMCGIFGYAIATFIGVAISNFLA